MKIIIEHKQLQQLFKININDSCLKVIKASADNAFWNLNNTTFKCLRV